MQWPDQKPPGNEEGRPGKGGHVSPSPTKINTIVRQGTDPCGCGAQPHPTPATDPSAQAAALRADLGWPPAPPRVRCEWCGAEPGERCVAPSRTRRSEIRGGRRVRRLAAVIHPSRWEAA